MWSTRREIGGGIYLSGVLFLTIGARLWPDVISGPVGFLFLLYALAGAGLLYLSLIRHGTKPMIVALIILATGIVTFAVIFYGLGLFITPVT